MIGKSISTALALVLAVLIGACDDQKQVTDPPATIRVSSVRAQDTEQIARGEAVYNAHCAECHGLRGVATPEWRKPGPDGKYPPPPLNDSAHAWHHPTEVLRKVIAKGSPAGMGNMPAWEDRLSPRQIEDVIAYIKSLWSDEIYVRWQQIESQAMAR